MALVATYRQNDGTLVKKAYIKIIRIWGSKSEGWNAFFGVFKKKTDQTPMTQFHMSSDYVEGENPYVRLYDVALTNTNLVDAESDIEKDALVKETPVVVEKKKKPKVAK